MIGWTISWSAHAAYDYRQAVDVAVVGSRGQFRTYPVAAGRGGNVVRAYLEASPQEPYRIRVRNLTGGRLGLVIAVDGRNIVSGSPSNLARHEAMYVLDPYATEEYQGWRTGRNQVNDFYFTEWPEAYAEAFRDRSARGVIAVAVFREQPHYRPPPQPYSFRDKAQPRPGAPSERHGEPGTGFGDETYSPSRRVEFVPEGVADSRYFFKYEWRESLCRKGIADCGTKRHRPRERNRFWPDDDGGYAPYPPNRGWQYRKP
ncbi:MAG: hypothetical protein ACREWG_16435 [Gammaproteobacteria bacterium]